MKVEIKNISVASVVFSAYPLLAFAMGAIQGFVNVFSGDYTLREKIMQGVIQSLTGTLAILVASIAAVFVYNLFVSFGIKGVRLTLSDVEEESK
jgi:type IV secretory pathway VirB2 component (pilin)